MQANFTVNSVTAESIAITVDIGGQPVQATVQGVVLELVAADGSTSPTFRYRPADVAAELAQFAPGTPVVLTVTPAV